MSTAKKRGKPKAAAGSRGKGKPPVKRKKVPPPQASTADRAAAITGAYDVAPKTVPPNFTAKFGKP